MILTASGQVDADTQATLLLCGRMGDSSSGSLKPLSLTEYNKVASWLHQRGMRPGDLVRSGAPEDAVREWADARVARERLEKLLSRGVGLGFALDRWSSQGIWVLSRGSERYPGLLKRRLGGKAPPLLFGVGSPELFERIGIAVVGSRDANEAASWFANRLGQRCAGEGVVVVSGGAKGIDREAMSAALDTGGSAIGVLPEGVAKAATRKVYRTPLQEGRLALLSDLDPDARWASWAAMARNKYIYSLSRYAVAVASATDGGTWAGATENLAKGWVPLFVRADEPLSKGNQALLHEGGLPLTVDVLSVEGDLVQQLESRAASSAPGVEPVGLFTNDDATSPMARPALHPVSPESAEALARREREASNGVSAEPGAASEEETQVSAQPVVGDLFDVVWPHLREALTAPAAPEALAETFDVNKAQIRAWLHKAEGRKLVRKLSRPVRYVANSQERIEFE